MSISILLDIVEDLAGDQYSAMGDSAFATLNCLHNSHSKVQIAAIQMYLSRWRSPELDDRFIDSCRKLVEEGPVSSVRTHALRAIGNIHSGSADDIVSRYLAQLLKVVSLPEPVQFAAYQSLREVQLGINEVDVMAASARLANELRAQLENSEFAASKVMFPLPFLKGVSTNELKASMSIEWDFVNQVLKSLGVTGGSLGSSAQLKTDEK